LTKKIAIFLLFSTFLFNDELFSQPAATVQLIGGYAVTLPDLKGEFGSTRNQFTGNGNPDSNTYFLKSGSNYGLVFKIPINRKKLPFNITGSLIISSFSNSTSYNIADTNYITVDLNQTHITFSTGIEYSLTGKKTIINPYFGIEMTMTLFSGQFTDFDKYLNTTNTSSLVHTVRAGFQASAGVDWVLHNNVGITAGARYTYANVFGKSSGTDKQSDYYLNDGERTNKGAFYNARKITYLQFFGGVSFYFGR